MTSTLWPIQKKPFLDVEGDDVDCGDGDYSAVIYKFSYPEFAEFNSTIKYIRGWIIPEDTSWYLWDNKSMFHIVGAKEIGLSKNIEIECEHDTDYHDPFERGWIRIGVVIYENTELYRVDLEGYITRNWSELEEALSFLKSDVHLSVYEHDKDALKYFDGSYDAKQDFFGSIYTVADFMNAKLPGVTRREKPVPMSPIQFIRSRMAKEPFEQFGSGEGKWHGSYNPDFQEGSRVRWSSGEHELGFPVEGATGVVLGVKQIGPKITVRVKWDALTERGTNYISPHDSLDLELISSNPVHHRFDPDFERELDSSNPQEPNEDIQGWANDYVKFIANFPPVQETPYVQVIPEVAREIARSYDELPECVECPDVREAYESLNRELAAQLHIIVLTIETYDGSQGEPYKSSLEMMADIKSNRHLWVFSGGADHPMMTREQTVIFRAVHDVFGHAAQGFAFGPRGEENAWMEHSKLFSPLARAALTTETRAQNSWVNYGPFSNLPVKERPYALQKAVLIPREFWTRPEFEEAYELYPEFVYGVEA
jgi:hypothetical protein